MLQVIYNYDQDWREDEELTVDILVSQKIAVSPDQARRTANGFLAAHVAMMVNGGQPTLVVGQTSVWRVPAILRLPAVGDVSKVGAVDIDAQTGALIPPSPNEITRMQELAMPWLPISHQRQRQLADCLAACAATVLDYWHHPVAYDDLRKLLRIGCALQVHLYNPAFSDASCTIPID